jgi:peptidoglycan DL-endopeptidase CwlO
MNQSLANIKVMNKRKKTTKKVILSSFAIAVIVTAILLPPNFSSASKLSDLRAQNANVVAAINESNQKLEGLTNTSNTLKGQIAFMNAQIAGIQSQIGATKDKIATLQVGLDQAQENLDKQKIVLQASVNTLYKNAGASTVELLIGSDSFTKFVDSQTYLQNLKDGITGSVQKIIALKAQIQSQQDDQKNLLNQQTAQQQQLLTSQNQVASLLATTQGQESSFQQHLADLRAQQQQILGAIAAQMAASGTVLITSDGYNGGYPAYLSNAPQDSLVDPWGMYNRECVSYAAFKVAQSGRTMPYWGGVGNAQQWPSNARADGIPVDRNPQVGDVAITYNAPFGHAMYVEAVNGRDVTISQYNWLVNGQWGVWSEMTLSADNTLLGPMYFIHFP